MRCIQVKVYTGKGDLVYRGRYIGYVSGFNIHTHTRTQDTGGSNSHPKVR